LTIVYDYLQFPFYMIIYNSLLLYARKSEALIVLEREQVCWTLQKFFIWRKHIERYVGDNIVEIFSRLAFLADFSAQLPNSSMTAMVLKH
jgi:hypothetical protein